MQLLCDSLYEYDEWGTQIKLISAGLLLSPSDIKKEIFLWC